VIRTFDEAGGTCKDPFSSFVAPARCFTFRKALVFAAVLACGDLHLENFASYKGDNRLVYFDVNDFDESCVAPVCFDLVRFLASVLVAARPLKLRDNAAMKLVDAFLDTYASNIADTKPRWMERSLAPGRSGPCCEPSRVAIVPI
jgi:hypothetical protein